MDNTIDVSSILDLAYYAFLMCCGKYVSITTAVWLTAVIMFLPHLFCHIRNRKCLTFDVAINTSLQGINVSYIFDFPN
jgi:hypothetical protein